MAAHNQEAALTAALLLSAGLHVLVGGFLMFFLPRWADSRRVNLDEAVTVQLLGNLSPPAPVAPAAPVDPNLKTPEVVEAPRSDPALNQPAPPAAALTAPAEVIPLGPKAPEKPVLQKVPTAPPRLTPPRVEPETPPKPRTPPNNDAEINKRLEALRRKTEADKLDADIESRVYNINRRQGAGRGESSEDSGGASGSQSIHPEKEAYYRQIKAIIDQNWRPPAGELAAGLLAVFTIKVLPTGQIQALRLDRSSGNSDYDLSVERAIRQSLLPPLPPIFAGQADTPAFKFNINDFGR